MNKEEEKKCSIKDLFIQYKNQFFYKIHQITYFDFKSVIYIDLKTLCIFLLVIAINMLCNLTNIGFPKEFPPISICIEILETLVRSIVVLLSIIFSFTLLSFQIFNKYFGRFAFTDFFKRKHLKIMFTLFILNVSFLIYTISYLKSCVEPNIFPVYGKVLFIEGILFSIILIFSIFPVMINLLSSSQSRQNIKAMFDSVDKTSFASYRFFDDNIDDGEYENNAFKVITEIGLTAIKEFDHTTFEIVLRSINKKAISVFKSNEAASDKLQLYANFTDNLKDFFSFAVKEKNNSAQQRIIQTRWVLEDEGMKHDFLKYNSPHYKGIDFITDIEIYFNRAVQNNEDFIAAEIVDTFIDYFATVIRKILPATFRYNYDHPYTNSEDVNTIFSYYRLIESLTTQAAATKKMPVLKNLSNLFMTLDIVIVESTNSTETKRYLLQINNLQKEKLLKNIIENAQIKNIESPYFPFGIGNTQELHKLKSSVILRAELKMIDYLFSKRLLNNYILNDLKTAAFQIIDDFSEDTSTGKVFLNLIVDKFDHIRGLITKTSSNEDKDLYINLHIFLGYIISKYTLTGINYEMDEKIREIMNRFPYLDDFKEELKANGFIQNTGL